MGRRGFQEFWKQGLLEYDCFVGIDWAWLSADGCMTKAPLGGKKTGKNPTDRGKLGAKRSLLVEGGGVPVGCAAAGAIPAGGPGSGTAARG